MRGLVPPSDLTRLAEDHPPGAFDPAAPASFEALLIGAALADAPGRARAASPVHRVTAGAPPFLVLHGTADTIVPHAQGERLATALREAGVPVGFRPVEGGDHLWVGLSEEEVERCFAATVEFAARCGGQGTERRPEV
ncbi:prolyl oligopeptidase family serine peptidase [Streptomyces sp. MN13]